MPGEIHCNTEDALYFSTVRVKIRDVGRVVNKLMVWYLIAGTQFIAVTFCM
jgi:hypothetical protein